MKTSILVFAALIAGCSTSTPVKRNFPDAVPTLQEKCPGLSTVESTGNAVSITDMLKTVVKNYGAYYECANKVDGWNEWYNTQRKIFENVK
jgi:hypothetical protein